MTVASQTAEAGPTPVDHGERYCIVGAGPAGLSQARAFKAAGIAYDLFEKHSDVGGIWDIDNPGSPMYESAHFISSKTLSGFVDYPMPEAYPDYPSHGQILAYLRAFARDHGLYRDITFGTAVVRAEPDGEGWRIRLSGGVERRYRGLVCANGMTWQPFSPDYPGSFDGEARHVVTYRGAVEFKGRRVLVVGGGNSGCDIACDAAQHADAAFISLRRGYHFIPKHIFGMPADVFGARRPRLPMAMKQRLFQLMLRGLLGDLRRYGLPRPDHRLFETHPILNGMILHHLSHGDLEVRPDIAELKGDKAVFVDGSEQEVDLILYATGYDMAIPFMDPAHFAWAGSRLKSYLSVFTRSDTLFTLGFLNTNAGVYGDFDRLAHLVACFVRDQESHPERAARFRHRIDSDATDLRGGIRFVDSARHASYLHHESFQSHLERTRRHMAWPALEAGCYEMLRRSAGSS